MFRWWGGSESPRCLVSWIAKWDVASVASEQELPLKLETFFLISIDGMFIWCLTRANARVNLYLLFCAVGNFDEYQTTNRQSQISIQYLPRAIIRFSKPKIIDRKFWDKKKQLRRFDFFCRNIFLRMNLGGGWVSLKAWRCGEKQVGEISEPSLKPKTRQTALSSGDRYRPRRGRFIIRPAGIYYPGKILRGTIGVNYFGMRSLENFELSDICVCVCVWVWPRKSW